MTNYLIGERCSGKTTRLIDFTSESGEPIVLRSYTRVDDLKKGI